MAWRLAQGRLGGALGLSSLRAGRGVSVARVKCSVRFVIEDGRVQLSGTFNAAGVEPLREALGHVLAVLLVLDVDDRAIGEISPAGEVRIVSGGGGQ